MSEIIDQIKNSSFTKAKSLVKTQLINDKKWLVRGMMALYARQTADEQNAEYTKYQNARGFNSCDAEILTSFAKQWQSRRWLSKTQMAILQRKMTKYAGQLARIARGEEVEVGD